MASVSLSRRDANVLEKIKDPESNPALGLMLDASLPKDSNLTDQAVYDRVSQKEREIVLAMQQLELEFAELRPRTTAYPTSAYETCVSQLGELISEYPKYASARNNRAQALRRLYGDTMLLVKGEPSSFALLNDAPADKRAHNAAVALKDLDTSISLLSPSSPFSAMSPTAAKTLSLAHTQRAAIYLATSKGLSSSSLKLATDRKEASWAAAEFAEAASRDFALGGRYGNDIAKGLAVSTNPTAKLCGEMVREMMKKEYGSELE